MSSHIICVKKIKHLLDYTAFLAIAERFIIPDGGLNFTDVCLVHQQHAQPAFADASADRIRQSFIDDHLMIREVELIFFIMFLKLFNE